MVTMIKGLITKQNKTMKKLLTIFFPVIFLITHQVSTVFAQEKDQDIPKLQNPFTVTYLQKNLAKSKPRMIYNDQIIEGLKEKIRTDSVIKNMYEAIRIDAFEILDLPVIKRVKTTRPTLGVSRVLRRRVDLLGVVYLVERDNTILERINQELLACCNFSDWNPPVYLDVAMISIAVALALDWTCDKLPETTIQLAKKALIEKGIYPSWEEYGGDMRNAWWIDHYNNWNQVCNAGMIAASIAIAEDEPVLAAKTIKRALDGLPYVLAEDYVPEGVYPEGVAYWMSGTNHSLLAASIFETAFGTDFGHKDYPGFMESATFKVMCSNSPSGGYYNFADCHDKPIFDGDIILAWFAAQTGKSMFYDKEKFLTPAKDIRLRPLTGAALAWMSKYQELSTEKPPSVWVGKGKTPVAVFKGEGNSSDYYFAAKGGCGAVSHGNMDAGSFIFELNGVRWSIDPGSQSYLIGEQGFDLWHQCQDCQRWELLTKNNHGHSTLTVNDERHIVDGYALVEKYKTGKNPTVTFDLSPTFEGQLRSAFRKFTKDSERSLLIEDIIESNETTELVTWQLITQADVEIVDEGAILKQNDQKLRLINLSYPDIQFSVVSLDPPPHQLDKQIDSLKRIELRIPVSNNDDAIRIKVQLIGE